jgi:hypothetical protein
LIIALFLIWLRRAYRALRRARNLLALATAVRTDTESLTRIENDRGDVTIEHHVKLQLVTDAERVFETRDEAYSTKHDVVAPPPATILASGVANRKLRIKFVYRGTVDISGELHTRQAWAYVIDPPLTRKGDFVEYSFAVQVPAMEADAFRPDGGIYFWEGGHDAGPGEVTLMAPPAHSIELLDAWVEEFDGTRVSVEQRNGPEVEASRSIRWHPEWKRGGRHVIRYRVRRHGTAPVASKPLGRQ